MADSIWWTKMLHKEDFCAHFCEMTDAEIVADIRKSIASFMQQRDDGDDFGARMVKKAKDRIESKSSINSENGKKGGRPRKEESGTAAETPSELVDEEMTHRTAAVRPNSSKRYPTKEEVYAFAQDRCLDEDDAREWFEIHAARGFKDMDGHPIKRWQGAVTMYCVSKAMKRGV